MAVMPGDVPYRRDQIYGWVGEFYGQSTVTDMREWLTTKLGADADMEVSTQAHDAWGDTTLLIDMIMSDIDSYTTDFI